MTGGTGCARVCMQLVRKKVEWLLSVEHIEAISSLSLRLKLYL